MSKALQANQKYELKELKTRNGTLIGVAIVDTTTKQTLAVIADGNFVQNNIKNPAVMNAMMNGSMISNNNNINNNNNSNSVTNNASQLQLQLEQRLFAEETALVEKWIEEEVEAQCGKFNSNINATAVKNEKDEKENENGTYTAATAGRSLKEKLQQLFDAP